MCVRWMAEIGDVIDPHRHGWSPSHVIAVFNRYRWTILNNVGMHVFFVVPSNTTKGRAVAGSCTSADVTWSMVLPRFRIFCYCRRE